MPKIRMLFSKRAGACFISHVDLPVMFARTASRAGLSVQLTEGFSPHPKMSFGPPLPVGVVGLNEPVDIWFTSWEEPHMHAFSHAMPKGFSVHSAFVPDGPSLSLCCTHAGYTVISRSGPPNPQVNRALGELPYCIKAEICEDGINLVLTEPDRYGAAKLVRHLADNGLISGWQDLLIVRTAIGSYTDGHVMPLTEAAV